MTQDREELVDEFGDLAHVEPFTPGWQHHSQKSQDHNLVEHFCSRPAEDDAFNKLVGLVRLFKEDL